MVFFSAAVSDSGPIQAVRGVKVVDIGVNSFTLSWKKTPGASGYKISWVPFLGKVPHRHSTMCANCSVTYMQILIKPDKLPTTISLLMQYLLKENPTKVSLFSSTSTNTSLTNNIICNVFTKYIIKFTKDIKYFWDICIF